MQLLLYWVINLAIFYAYRVTGDDPSTLVHHDHDCHELVLIEKGQSTFSIENRLYTAQAHSLVVIGNLERHHIRIDQVPYHRQIVLIPNSLLIQQVRLPQLASFFLYRPQNFTHVLELDEELFQLLRQRFDRIIDEFQADRPLKEHQLGLLVEMMLVELYRRRSECFNWESTPDMDTVFRVQRYVAQHFREDLTLLQMAETHHVSHYHLSRCFHTITGTGFQQYLTLCRLNEAKRLLLSTALPITLVAEQCGYGDVNNFIRIFRSREGITPLKYRKIGGSQLQVEKA